MSTFYIEQFGCRATQADGAAIERKLLAQNPAAKILVTGCYAQRAPEELAALPGVSFVVGNSHKPQIPGLIFAQQNLVQLSSVGPHRSAPQASRLLIGDIFATRDVLVAPVLGGEGNHTRPTLKIQDGCNNRCSFCVIPFVRGKSRSLPP